MVPVHGVTKLLSSVRTAMLPHVPFAQVLQTPEHAALQHLPSSVGQNPLLHWLVALHMAASSPLQVPAASHFAGALPAGEAKLSLSHVSASTTFTTALQLPAAFAQLWHPPVQALTQHRPSFANPLRQCVLSLAVTEPSLPLHTPAELHAHGKFSHVPNLVESSHAPASGRDLTPSVLHVPSVVAPSDALQVEQPSVQATLQHKPSAL